MTLSQTSWQGGRTWFVLVVVFSSLAVTGVQNATAANLYVNGTTGNDANNCTTPVTACMTIQAAVIKAAPNDTINVAAGIYPEPAAGPLTINKTLTLLGAQAGVDARFPRGPESSIQDPQGTSVSASDVVIDGFTVRMSVVSAFTGYGLWLNPGISGTEIVNNIVEDNIIGIGLANSGASPALIRHNLIRNNTIPGSGSGTGIYTDEFSGGATVRNVLIEENTFSGHAGSGAAINISNTDFANGVFDLQVLSNLFDMNSRAFLLFNTHDSVFDDNTITSSTFVGSADVRLFDNNSNLVFTNNDLRGGTGHAIRFSSFFALASSDVEFHQNNIELYALTGLTVDPLSHLGTVNAECNWWNSPSGPLNVPNNPTGTGEEVVGDADFTPWLLARAPSGPCLGGLPSTPGRVTGGGQIGSDPVFSLLGDLISLPALVPSVADPSSQATFGFVARCCEPAGNLEYNDHRADVRIKAQTVDGVFISSPGTSCPSIPGSRHATFTGLASVIRPIGTTTERYTVDVDDCGEPGTQDTFGIKTTTYANGPSTLIGGNIQIKR
jgi:hypothetical protein